MTTPEATGGPGGSAARVPVLGGLLARARRPAVTPGHGAVAGPRVADATETATPLTVPGGDDATTPLPGDLVPAPPAVTTASGRSLTPVDDPAPVIEVRRRDAVDVEASTPPRAALVPHPEPVPVPVVLARPAPSLPPVDRPAPASPLVTPRGAEPLPELSEHRSTRASTTDTAPSQIAAMTQRGSREPVRPAVDRDSSPVARVDPSPPLAAAVPVDAPVHPAAAPSLPVQRVDAAPPVSIGEIHVHVAAPAGATPDPLALLAPYADGITARRAGAR